MSRRFALVAWWLGAILAGLCVLCALAGVFIGLSGTRDGFIGVFVSLFFAVPAAICWALAFVLAGSFWKPPRPE